MRRALINLRIALAPAVLLAGCSVVCAQEIGTAAAVNPAAQARGQSGSRTIVIGQSIAHRERIQTTSAGSVQLLFVDKTSMTIGPNSDLAIDEYVFDPQANTGRLSATLAKGVMRFVGGQVSHNGSAEIKTPNGLVGIRGGVGIIGTHQVFIGFGRGTVTSGSSTVTLDPGEYTQIANGVPPTSPGPPPPGLIANLLSHFQSQGSQGGGAPASAGAVNNARSAVTGSQNGPVVSGTPPSGEGERQPSNPQTTTRTTQLATEAVLAVTPVRATPPPPPVPTPSQPPITPIAGPPEPPAPQPIPQPLPTGPTNNPAPNPPNNPPPPPLRYGAPAFTFALGSGGAPHLPAGFTTGSNSFYSQGMGYSPQAAASRIGSGEAVVNQGNPPPPATFFQWGVGISGSGASQSSWLSVVTGTVLGSGDDLTFSGGFGATRRGAGNMSMGRASGFLSSAAGSVVVDDQGIPLGATINQQDYVAATNQYRNVQAQFSLGGTGALTNYGFSEQVTRTVAPTGFGAYRPGQVLTGWTGGLMQTVSGSSTSSPFATAGVAEIILDPARGRVQATFDVVNMTPNSLDGFFAGTFRMGSTSSAGNSSYVDYENFAARETVVVNPSGTQRVQLSTVNFQRVTNANTFMVNVPRDVARQILPNTTVCECEYTRWGFWSSDTQRTSLFGNRSERGHMMTWVAGQLPEASEVPRQGVATYTGHVVANVSNNGAQYIASGNLTNTVNFGTRSGTAQVAGFDGANYQGQLQLSQQDPRYIGAGLTSNVGNRAMVMTGSFFRGSQGPVGEMGGNVTVLGRNYLGSGIFAGRAN